MVSLSESKCDKYIDGYYHQLLAYTSGHLVKAYPGGLRADSSNMDPIPKWFAGMQCGACVYAAHLLYYPDRLQ